MKILFFALLLALFSNKTSVAQLGIEASRETGCKLPHYSANPV
jgi:hypothetical protein